MLNDKNKLVILDFDHTLFDTELFKHNLKKVYVRNGVGKERFDETYNQIRLKLKKPYDPILHLSLLKGEVPDVENLVKEVNYLVDCSVNYLYDDVIDFLEKIKNVCDIYLVSLGVKHFQKPKVDNCKINYYFYKIIFTEGQNGFKGEIYKDIISENIKKKIVVIDDVPENIDYVKRGFPDVKTIKIERFGGKYSKERAELNDFTIKNLTKAVNIVKSVL